MYRKNIEKDIKLKKLKLCMINSKSLKFLIELPSCIAYAVREARLVKQNATSCFGVEKRSVRN